MSHEPGTESGVAAASPTDRTFAEFFAGIGLMRLGLERQGWRVEYANDIDPQKKAMYDGHFGTNGHGLVLGDVHCVEPADVPTVALATASFPCNDLSLAGARRGLSGTESSAFWGFMRVMSGMGMRRPPLILLENVPGFLTSHGGRDFLEALDAVASLGYRLDTFVVDASEFVPQSRQRLFVLGLIPRACSVSDDVWLTGDSLTTSTSRPPALVSFVRSHPQLPWMLRRLPSLPRRTGGLDDIIECLPDTAPEWWSGERVEYLLAQMSPRHRAIADRMVTDGRPRYATVFRRVRRGRSMAELRADGVAGCLRTPRGGSGRQILFAPAHGVPRARLLTPRECAALMGAPDYRISVPANQALFGFGDAVCVPVIEWIARHCLDPLVPGPAEPGARLA